MFFLKKKKDKMLILLANKYYFVNQIKLQNPLFFFGVSHKNVLFKKLYDDGATSKSGSNSGKLESSVCGAFLS